MFPPEENENGKQKGTSDATTTLYTARLSGVQVVSLVADLNSAHRKTSDDRRLSTDPAGARAKDEVKINTRPGDNNIDFHERYDKLITEITRVSSVNETDGRKIP